MKSKLKVTWCRNITGKRKNKEVVRKNPPPTDIPISLILLLD